VRKQFVNRPRLPDVRREPDDRKTPTRKAETRSLPTTGIELHQRLREADSALAAKGLCSIGALLAHVAQAGVKAGYGADLNQWSGPAIDLAVAETRSFKSRLPSAPEATTAA
jgi:hypothetical protein